jgi:hypothetical protein
MVCIDQAIKEGGRVCDNSFKVVQDLEYNSGSGFGIFWQPGDNKNIAPTGKMFSIPSVVPKPV